jgi:hypothetical protein
MASNPFEEKNLTTSRIPLYGFEDQRIAANTDAGPSLNSLWDQVLVNCFPIAYKNPLAPDSASVKIVSRPGTGSPEQDVDLTGKVNTPNSCIPLAALNMTQLDDVLIVALYDTADTKIYILQYRRAANTCTLLNPAASGLTGWDTLTYVHLSELNIGGTPYLGVVISDHPSTVPASSAGYYAPSASGVFAASSMVEITDADFPPKQATPLQIVGPMVQMNDFTYVMTRSGKVYNSDRDSITSWNTAGFVDAQSYPDRGLGLARYKHHLIAFGEESIEFWQDEGNAAPASPLGAATQAFIKFGSYNQKSFINIDDELWFIGKSNTANFGLYKLSGYTPVLVSQPSQSAHLSVGEVDLQPYSAYGTSHIIINVTRGPNFKPPEEGTDTYLPTNNGLRGSLVYCIDSNAWWIYAFEELDEVTKFITAHQTTDSNTIRYMWFNSFGSGTSYGLHPMYRFEYSEQVDLSYDTFRSGNSATLTYWRIPVLITTAPIDFGSEKRKFIRNLKVIGDRIRTRTVVATPWTTFNAEELRFYISYTKVQDAATLTHESDWTDRWVVVPNTYGRYFINNCGSGREWVFKLFCNSYVSLRLEALEATIAIGTH